MKAIALGLLVGLSTAYAQASDCVKEAEKFAIDDAKKEDKTMNAAKETSRITDAESLKVSKVKGDEGCKKVSVEATEL
jgi:hypothetical protein